MPFGILTVPKKNQQLNEGGRQTIRQVHKETETTERIQH